MAETDIRHEVKSQLATLETLLAYLEECDQLGAKEYLFCQARLNDAIKNLRKLEHFSGRKRRES